MQKIFLIAILFTSFSCATIKDPYLLSNLPNIRELEKQDHQTCTSLKLDLSRKDEFLNQLYWRCRLSFVRYRLSAGNDPMQAKNDLEIRDLINKISLKIFQTPESVLRRENKKIDDRQHKQCLAMGFVINVEDQAKIDDYFACRKALIDEQQLIPPYGNADYEKYQNHSYSIGFVIDQHINEAIRRYNEAKEKYPTCTRFNLDSLNFKRCRAAQDKSRQCVSEIPNKKFMEEGEVKVACQKQAYQRFGDWMLKSEDARKKEIEKTNKKSDFYNKQNLASLGIDGTKFFGGDGGDKDKESDEKSAEDINSDDGLYEKFELTKLRQKYVIACQRDASKRVDEFVTSLTKSCDDLAKFEEVGQ